MSSNSSSYRLVASTCSDGDCPKRWVDDTTGDVIVRGRLDDDPATERDIRFTAAEWETIRGGAV